MKEYEYEEENLDDFMVNAANILSEEDNSEKNTIIESLKQHLSSIFHNQNEMENFFMTLNGVIFTSNSSKKNVQKIDNRQPFILYPTIFSFNPRTTSYFLEQYLNCLQKCICEDNRGDFSFLSEVFGDIVFVLFSDEKNNQNLIKKSYLLEQNKKKNIYEKFLNFCNTNIRTNKKIEQSFGCLLLTEFIEKCPLVKEDKNLDNLFKTMSDYLDDRWFECKLDLLNCTISLIFAAEYKFKPYATICLFRVLDYLTDSDWMKRKLAINIVYTLVFYCKEEIMAVKENIIEFVNMLKEDSVDEVREICMHTLKFLGEDDEEDNDNDEINANNENIKPKNVYNKYKNKSKNTNQRNKLNRSFNGVENGDSQTIRSARSNKSQKIKNKNEDLRKKLQKEKDTLEKMERDFSEKKKNYKNNYNSKSANNTKSATKINTKGNELGNVKGNSKSKQNFSKATPLNNNSQEIMNSTINSILEQIKKLQEAQTEFREMLTNLKQTAGNNYLNLNERLRALEKNPSRHNRNAGYPQNNTSNGNYNNSTEEFKQSRSQRDYRDKKLRPLLNKSDEKIKIEQLKNIFNEGGYNEALLETNQNDRYLLKLLPLIEKKIIPKIEIALLEDAISRLNKRIPILCMEERRENIKGILLFYIQLLKSKIELKLITQLSIKDALTFLKSKGSYLLTQDDSGNLDLILGSLRV